MPHMLVLCHLLYFMYLYISVQVRLEHTTSEICCYGTNPIIDEFFLAGTFALHMTVHVTWGTVLHVSSATTVLCDSWAFLTVDSTTFLAKICTYFAVNGVVFVRHQPFPLDILTQHNKFSSLVAPLKVFQEPKLPHMSHSITEITALTLQHRFVVDTDVHFIKG